MNKEEIEKAKDDLMFFNEGDYITREMDRNANILREYIKELEQENKTLTQTNKSYKGIINKQIEGKKNTIKELNKRMCNFADTLEPETILKYGEIKMEDIDNNTYELLAVYTLGLLGDIYKIVKEEI